MSKIFLTMYSTETICCRLKDLLRSDDVLNDKSSQSEQDNSANSFPNKEEARSDHTHWMSGDDTDSDWASPVKHLDNRTTSKSLSGFNTRKHAGTKRSLFSLDDSDQKVVVLKKSVGMPLNLLFVSTCTLMVSAKITVQ